MARRRRTVDGFDVGRLQMDKAKWALVGGLKEESRIYIVSSFEDWEVGFRISKDLGEEVNN